MNEIKGTNQQKFDFNMRLTFKCESKPKIKMNMIGINAYSKV
jgi:hypothetical protein